MIKILKRDGSIKDFDIKKIENAIERAFASRTQVDSKGNASGASA